MSPERNAAGKPIEVPLTRLDARERLGVVPVDPPVAFRLPFVERLLDGLSDLCLMLASLALVVLVAIFGWLVFGRYVLNDTPTWVEQLALLLVIAITFLGSATLVHEDRHLGVTFIRDALPQRLRIAVRLLCDTALAVFGLFMMLVCSELVAFSWGNTLPMLGIPEGVRSLPAAIAGALIALFAGYRSIVGMATLFARRPAPPETDIV